MKFLLVMLCALPLVATAEVYNRFTCKKLDVFARSLLATGYHGYCWNAGLKALGDREEIASIAIHNISSLKDEADLSKLIPAQTPTRQNIAPLLKVVAEKRLGGVDLPFVVEEALMETFVTQDKSKLSAMKFNRLNCTTSFKAFAESLLDPQDGGHQSCWGSALTLFDMEKDVEKLTGQEMDARSPIRKFLDQMKKGIYAQPLIYQANHLPDKYDQVNGCNVSQLFRPQQPSVKVKQIAINLATLLTSPPRENAVERVEQRPEQPLFEIDPVGRSSSFEMEMQKYNQAVSCYRNLLANAMREMAKDTHDNSLMTKAKAGAASAAASLRSHLGKAASAVRDLPGKFRKKKVDWKDPKNMQIVPYHPRGNHNVGRNSSSA